MFVKSSKSNHSLRTHLVENDNDVCGECISQFGKMSCLEVKEGAFERSCQGALAAANVR